jgi:hypothetical protein
MTNTISFHDYTIVSILVDARERRLCLRASGESAGLPGYSVAEFSGIVAYRFDGDVLGTILFDIEECDPMVLYEKHAAHMQATYNRSGGHAPWVSSIEEARTFISTNAIRGFEVSASIGVTGVIWCRGFLATAESSPMST